MMRRFHFWQLFLAVALLMGDLTHSFRASAQDTPSAPPETPSAPQAPAVTPVPEVPPVETTQLKKKKKKQIETADDATWEMEPGGRRDIVEHGADVVIEADEAARDVVVLSGNARIDGRVRELVVLKGTAEINGTVERGAVVVLGGLKLGPNAKIGRDAVMLGGPSEIEEGAEIGGDRVLLSLPHLASLLPSMEWLHNWSAKGLLMARPLPHQFSWAWVFAGVCAVFFLLLALLFPRPVQASVMALEDRPIGSFFMGILLLVLLGPLLFILGVSVIGIVAIPFVLAAGLAAFFFGKAAVYAYAGRQLTRPFGSSDNKLLLWLLVGVLVFYLIYMVPVAGFVAWFVATLLGLGAVLLAAFRAFQSEGTSSAFSAPPVVVTQASLGVAPTGQSLAPGEVLVLQRVGFWRRTLAMILDFVLLSLLIAVVGPGFLLIWIAYHVGMWAWKGTTIGGMVMGIKIVRLNGGQIPFSVALVRSLASVFSALALGLGFFWAGWDRDRQAWHDKIAGTLVVRVPKGISLA